MTFTQYGRIQNKNDTAANLTAQNPTLLAGEFCSETDTDQFKIGPGAWNSLSYAGGGGGSQTLANTSNSTSHTVTLSGSGGSLQLVEGANITLTTTGTSGAGVVTIASTGGDGGGSSVSITDTATQAMAANATYVCAATSSDYTVTMTTAGLSAGDVVTFVFPAANTKLVTLSCAGGLAGSTTRAMRNGESAVIRWSGSTFERVGGVNKPFAASMRLSANVGPFSPSVESKINLNVALVDDGYGTVNTTTNRLTLPRAGAYELSVSPRLFDTIAGTIRQYAFLRLNGTAGTYECNSEVSIPPAGSYAYIRGVAPGVYAAGDYFELYAAVDGINNFTLTGGGPGTANTWAGFKELPSW